MYIYRTQLTSIWWLHNPFKETNHERFLDSPNFEELCWEAFHLQWTLGLFYLARTESLNLMFKTISQEWFSGFSEGWTGISSLLSLENLGSPNCSPFRHPILQNFVWSVYLGHLTPQFLLPCPDTERRAMAIARTMMSNSGMLLLVVQWQMKVSYPIGSMHGMFTYIWLIFMVL